MTTNRTILALRALATLVEQRATDALIAYYRDPNPSALDASSGASFVVGDVRHAAAALEAHGTDPVVALREAAVSARTGAAYLPPPAAWWMALATAREQAADELSALLEEPDAPADVRAPWPTSLSSADDGPLEAA